MILWLCPSLCSSSKTPRGGYLARALGESILNEADDLDGLRATVRDAVLCHFDEEGRKSKIRLTAEVSADSGESRAA